MCTAGHLGICYTCAQSYTLESWIQIELQLPPRHSIWSQFWPVWKNTGRNLAIPTISNWKEASVWFEQNPNQLPHFCQKTPRTMAKKSVDYWGSRGRMQGFIISQLRWWSTHHGVIVALLPPGKINSPAFTFFYHPQIDRHLGLISPRGLP